MSSLSQSVDPALADADWVRALALRMVCDAAEADDLAQETLLAAWASQAPRRSLRRRFLAAVLRNVVRQSRRSAARRGRRERACAVPEVDFAGDPVDVAAQLERHREVVDAVEALAEPYRTAVWLRFFEDLPPRSIAERLQVPVKTVDSRLHRGLAQLRARLGGSRAWAALWMPLAWGNRPPTAVACLGTALVVSMSLKVKLWAAAAVAVIGASWFLVGGEAAGSEAGQRPAVDRPRSTARAGGGGAPAGGSPARQSVVPRSTTSAARAPVPMRALRARVLDVEAAPLAGVEVRFSPTGGGEETSMISDGQGWLAADVRDVRGVLRPADVAWVAVMEGAVVPLSEVPPVVVLARALDLAGTVVDGAGTPVTGASVSVELPVDFAPRFAVALDNAIRRQWRTTTAAEGGFALARVPAVAGAVVEVVHRDYRKVEQELPAGSDPAMWITLTPRDVGDRLAGRVLLPDGAPASEARVAIGMHAVETDVRGVFELDLARRWSPQHRVVAVQAGYLPAYAERPADTGEWPDYLELRLGGPPLSISGRVVRPDGQPVQGASVWIADPTSFGAVLGVPAQVESLSAGVAPPPRPYGDGSPPRGQLDLTIPQSTPNLVWAWVTTDAAGRFELPGLAPRSYRVAAMHRETLQLVEQSDVAAGSAGIELVLAEGALHEQVRGRLLSQAGRPLAGLRVRVVRRSFEHVVAAESGTLDIGMMSNAGSAVSDAEGRFELREVPKQGVFLYIVGDHVVEHTHFVEADDGDGELEVRLTATGNVRVETALQADAVGLADADGRRLDVVERSAGGGVNAWLSVPLVDGRSSIFAAPEHAAFVILFSEGVEVGRLPLNVVPGSLTRVGQ